MSHPVQVAFPYAYPYLSETGVPPERLASTFASFDRMTHRVLNTLVKDTARPAPDIEATSVPDMYYWEVAFRSNHQHGFFEIGLCRNDTHVCYRSDGTVGMKWSQRGRRRFESYGAAGDVVGCGISNSGGSVFFTKNGKHVISFDTPYFYEKWLYPFISSDSKSYVAANFGRSPFKFNISGYCDYSLRVGASASRLPPEIVLLIAQHVIGDSMSGIADYSTLCRLARVCRYWYKLCSTVFTVAKVELRSRSEMKTATNFGLLGRTKTLVTREHDSDTWLHAFPSNYSMRVLPQVTSWTCDYGSARQRPTSILEDRTHAYALAGLVKLELRHRRFKAWSQFAHFVFSFRHLEELDMHGVIWDDEIMAPTKTPPKWLAFSRRLRKLRFDAGDGVAGVIGSVWLFIAGRRRGKEPAWHDSDISIIAQFVKLVIPCVSKSDHITYALSEDGICYELMLYKEQSYSPTLKLTLQPTEEQGGFIRLSTLQITYRTDRPLEDFPKESERLLLRLFDPNLIRVVVIVHLPEETLADESHEIQQILEQTFPQFVARGHLRVMKKILPRPYYAKPTTNSSRFSRFIHETMGQLANWEIWREIKVGDYGVSIDRGKEGNIYTSPPSAGIAELAAQFPPLISASNKEQIITSVTTKKRDVTPQTNAGDTLAKVELEISERRDAFLAMSSPITARLPNEFIDSAKALLGDRYVVTETTTCSAFLMYLSPGIRETVTISLQMDDPAVVTGEYPSCRWTHSGGAGYFREGVDTAPPSFTPIYNLTYMHPR